MFYPGCESAVSHQLSAVSRQLALQNGVSGIATSLMLLAMTGDTPP